MRAYVRNPVLPGVQQKGQTHHVLANVGMWPDLRSSAPGVSAISATNLKVQNEPRDPQSSR